MRHGKQSVATARRAAGRLTIGFWRISIRTAYRLIYGPLNGLYDAAATVASGGSWRAWQAATLPHLRGPRVLEIACGPGYLLARIAVSGHAAVGLDRSPQMLRRTRRLAPVVRSDAHRLPFGDGTFDTVVMTFSGLTVDAGVLAEAWRVTRPGGRLVTLDQVAVHGWDWRALLARGVLGATSGGIAWPVRQRMEAAGFAVSVYEETVGANVAHVVVGLKADAAP